MPFNSKTSPEKRRSGACAAPLKEPIVKDLI
jgi:hypothetical protein